MEKCEINIENKKYSLSYKTFEQYVKIYLKPDDLFSIIENKELNLNCGKNNINDSMSYIQNELNLNNFKHEILKTKKSVIEQLKITLTTNEKVCILFSSTIQLTNNTKNTMEKELSEAKEEIKKLISKNNELIHNQEILKKQNIDLFTSFNLKINLLKQEYSNLINSKSKQIKELEESNKQLLTFSQSLMNKIISFQNILNDLNPIQKNLQLYDKRSEIKAHTRRINNFAKFPNSNKFASSGDDNKICIYDKIDNTYKSIIIINNAHNHWILDILAIDNNHLISVGCDYHIKIFEFDFIENKYKIICTYQNAHNGNIQRIIELSNNIYATCSNDSKIKIWNIFKEKNSEFKIILLNTIKNYHNSWIQFIIKVNNNTFCSGCYGGKIIVIDSITFEKKFVFTGITPTGWNTATRINDSIIAVGDRQIYILDIILHQKIKIINSNFGQIRTLKYMRDNTLLCACQNCEIRQYNCEFYNEIANIKENGAMYAIEELNDGNIVFGGTNCSTIIKG